MVRPWFTNVAKALRKEPKWFQRDWGGLTDDGARAESLVACHLLKAVEGWTDLGFGDFELRYLGVKQKREVDFLVVRDRKPWFLVEVKLKDTGLSPALTYFQTQTKAAHAFQVVMNLPYEPADCFGVRQPVVVPAKTFLSPSVFMRSTMSSPKVFVLSQRPWDGHAPHDASTAPGWPTPSTPASRSRA